MSRVLCVHGIAQEFKSRESLLSDWEPSLRGGVSNARGSLDSSDIDMAFYGLLFRPSGAKGGLEIPDFRPGDVEQGLEAELIADLFNALEAPVTMPEATKGPATQRSVAHMLQAIAGTPVFGKLSQRVVIWFLKQVHRYLTEQPVRQAAQQSLLDRVGDDTRVIVAHSLGTVVAYETLCANSGLPVHTLVTLGSPLGMPALLPHLIPAGRAGRAEWPGGLEQWFNIADAADVVALRKRLRPLFGERVIDEAVNNGATMHDVLPYLTAPETGRAVLAGLALG